MEEFTSIFKNCHGAFRQSRTLERGINLAQGLFNCAGRRTLTGILTSRGLQFKDWTAYYKLFQGERMNTEALFHGIQQEILTHHLNQETPVSAHLDDTLLHKVGKKIPKTRWLRDPLGPPFHTNFVWGQRFIQLSVACAIPGQSGAAQSIPVDFHACPPVKKVSATATKQEKRTFKEEQKKLKLSQVGADRILLFREQLDQQGQQRRKLIVSVDGSYTNDTVFKQLPIPERVTLIGRIRKDCRLYDRPEFTEGAGRKRVYGEPLPTPEQMRQSSEVPWVKVKAWATGKIHDFQVKIIKNVKWRKAGDQDLQIVIIRPLGYRLTKTSKILYRKAAYLVCTDTNMSIEEFLQNYLWRWGIEVNFREEKTNLGCGQAQVRNEVSVSKMPEFIVACYAMLLLAEARMKKLKPVELPRSKWYPKKSYKDKTTGDLMNEFRAQIWLKYMGINFSHFVDLQKMTMKSQKFANPLFSAHFYTRN